MGFRIVKKFRPPVISEGQRSRSNPKNFEVKYLENGTRYSENVNRNLSSNVSKHFEIESSNRS